LYFTTLYMKFLSTQIHDEQKMKQQNETQTDATTYDQNLQRLVARAFRFAIRIDSIRLESRIDSNRFVL